MTCCLFVLVVSITGVRVSADIARWHPTPLDLPRASLHVSPDQAQIYRSALRFIDDCAPPGEAIFVKVGVSDVTYVPTHY